MWDRPIITTAITYDTAINDPRTKAAAIVIACILERAGQINSAGGYLRNLTQRARQGEFSLAPMVMALLRAQGGGEGRKAG